jgi:hypothetical protein
MKDSPSNPKRKLLVGNFGAVERRIVKITLDEECRKEGTGLA